MELPQCLCCTCWFMQFCPPPHMGRKSCADLVWSLSGLSSTAMWALSTDLVAFLLSLLVCVSFNDILDGTWAPCCLTSDLVINCVNPFRSSSELVSTLVSCLSFCNGMEDHKPKGSSPGGFSGFPSANSVGGLAASSL